MLPAGVKVLCDEKEIVVEKEMVLLLGYLILYACVAIVYGQNVLGILQIVFLVGMVAFFVPKYLFRTPLVEFEGTNDNKYIQNRLKRRI